jgi:hypothetical protein
VQIVKVENEEQPYWLFEILNFCSMCQGVAQTWVIQLRFLGIRWAYLHKLVRFRFIQSPTTLGFSLILAHLSNAMTPLHGPLVFLVLVSALLAALAWALGAGSIVLSWSEVWQGLWQPDSANGLLIWQLRIPRLLSASIA